MRTQLEILEEMKCLIPSDMWTRYAHLTFGEMAEIPELAEWHNALAAAEDEWFEAG